MKYLTIVLYATGVIYLVGVPILMMGLNASGWTWTPRQPEYEQMIMGVYATLGVFLILAAKIPCSTPASSGSRSGRMSCTEESCCITASSM